MDEPDVPGGVAQRAPAVAVGTVRPRVRHADDAPHVALLTIGRPQAEGAYAGPIYFDACYGGVAIGRSTLLAGRRELTLELPGLADWMDDRGITVRVWSDAGPVRVRATCVRRTYRPTAAEVKAGAKWPGVRGRRSAPDTAPALIDGVRSALTATCSRSPRQVVVYEGTDGLLDRRRARLTGARRSLVPRRGGSSGFPDSP